MLQELFLSQRPQGTQRKNICLFFNLCASVSSVRYDLFAPPLYIEQLLHED